MRRRLRFGIVGCGAVTLKAHLPALLSLRTAKLAALVDSDLDWARELAGKTGAAWAGDDHRQLEGRVDAAIVATPVSTHPRIVCDLLDMGLHVLCEKPAAARARDVATMFAKAGENERKLLIGQNHRFAPQLEFLHALFAEGLLHRDGRLEASLGGRIDRWPARTDYRNRPEASGGGALIDQGVHLVDLAIWIFGEAPVRVTYQAEGPEGRLELDAEVRLEFESGGRAHLAASHSRGLSGAVDYRSPSGWARTRMTSDQLDFHIADARACRLDGPQRPALERVNTTQLFARQLQHLCEAVLQDRPLVVRDSEAIQVIETIERCYRSIPDAGSDSG